MGHALLVFFMCMAAAASPGLAILAVTEISIRLKQGMK